MRHQRHAERVEQGSPDERPGGAEFVGDHAGKRRGDPVDQVLDRERDGERLPAPAEIERHRLQVQTETVPGAERQREDDAAADEDDERRAPVRGGHHA